MPEAVKPEDIPDYPEMRLGIIFWEDASIWSKGEDSFKPKEDWHRFLGHSVSFGAISKKDGVLLIVHEFSDGKPDTYSYLPRPWAYKVIWLAPVKEVKDEKPSQTR